MPELPDIVIYIESLLSRVLGQRLDKIRLASPFFLRSFHPPIEHVYGKRIVELRRIGKRIVFGLEDHLFLVLHLMIAGRLHWRASGEKVAGKNRLAALDFANGSILITEAGSKKRASLHLVRGEKDLEALDPRGLEVLQADLGSFRSMLVRETHTLKRCLTDPHLISGIGNAYSDEILHRARLSPLKTTDRLTLEESERLFVAIRETLLFWVDRLRREVGPGFPEKVTAFREGMAVHGRFKLPCPVCGSPVQRIVYAENETNYCASCQTNGKLLADRSLSRLLRDDWPRNLAELDERRNKRQS